MNLEEERDALRRELTVYSEMLAQVLHVTGPVKIEKGDGPSPTAVIDADFDPTGKFVTVQLVENVQVS